MKVFISYTLLLLAVGQGAQSQYSGRPFVVSQVDLDYFGGEVLKNEMKKDPSNPPRTTKLEITSDITNRYAVTTYKSTVLNPANITQETTFFVVTPEEAYITAFVMNIDGKNYTASVKEKKKAENVYNQAVNSGYSAAHVAVSTRNANKFTVNVNIGSNSSAIFFLTYEELLKRKSSKYSLVTNINPKQLVENLNVFVNIHESLNLSMVEVLPLSSGEDMTNKNDNLTPRVNLQRNGSQSAMITFNPSIEEQKKYASALKTPENEGFSGQFIVTYDVERKNSGGEILVEDGYFVHFFAPPDLPVMPKYIIFVVDTSGSMYGRRIEQLREALRISLKSLNPHDVFTIIEFNSDIKIYKLDALTESTIIKITNRWLSRQTAAVYSEHQVNYDELSFPPAYDPNNSETLKKALDAVDKIQATGSTNIFESLRAALHMVDITMRRTKNGNGDEIERQPIILFCTDGEPVDGLTDTKEIVKEVHRQNKYKVPIFSMSFGDGSDKKFLRELSGKNYGLSRHIYESADAALQIDSFYQEISSPLLTNVTFEYTDNVTEHTREVFPILFRGNEFVISGKFDGDFVDIMPKIRCRLPYPPNFIPKIKEVKVGNIERQWAYLTTKQFIEKNETSKALDLALKYSFVTPLTSMVVVKPNSTAEPVNLVDALSSDNSFNNRYSGRMPARSFSRMAAPMGRPMMPMMVGGAMNKMSRISTKILPGATRTASGPTVLYDMVEDADDDTGSYLSIESNQRVSAESTVDSYDSGLSYKPMKTRTSASTPAPKPKSLPPKVSKGLPWLQSHVTPADSLDFLKGSYTFGFGRTNTTVSSTSCTTMNSKPGKCLFLDEADSVYKKVTDVLSFKDHFCVVNKQFIGLCCPV